MAHHADEASERWLAVRRDPARQMGRGAPSRVLGTWRTAVTVRADTFVRFCYLVLTDDGIEHWFDDNFFDLPSGATHRVLLTSSAPVRAERIRVGHWNTVWPWTRGRRRRCRAGAAGSGPA